MKGGVLGESQHSLTVMLLLLLKKKSGLAGTVSSNNKYRAKRPLNLSYNLSSHHLLTHDALDKSKNTNLD